MRYALLTLGFTTTVSQVLLARELVAVFYGNELILGLILAAWLAWGALGAWAGGRFQASRGKGASAVSAGLTLLGWLPALQVLLARAARTLMGVPPGALVEFGPAVAAILLLGAPTPLLAGALFPLLARGLAEEGHSPAAAYVWECVGAAVGGVLFRFLFVQHLDPVRVAAFLALLGSLAPGPSLSRNPCRGARPPLREDCRGEGSPPPAPRPRTDSRPRLPARRSNRPPRQSPLAVARPDLRRRFPLRPPHSPGAG